MSNTVEIRAGIGEPEGVAPVLTLDAAGGLPGDPATIIPTEAAVAGFVAAQLATIQLPVAVEQTSVPVVPNATHGVDGQSTLMIPTHRPSYLDWLNANLIATVSGMGPGEILTVGLHPSYSDSSAADFPGIASINGNGVFNLGAVIAASLVTKDGTNITLLSWRVNSSIDASAASFTVGLIGTQT